MKHITTDERAAMFADLDKPSLAALSYKLRHRETWPPGFVWHYDDCKQCAMGLAHQLWRESIEWPGFTIVAEAFDISKLVSIRLFSYSGAHRNILMSDVTPEMVADDIDAYLAKTSSRR